MAERGRYRTKQQELILNCLKQQEFRFLTIEQFMDCLRREEICVGQTTVYRALERLAEAFWHSVADHQGHRPTLADLLQELPAVRGDPYAVKNRSHTRHTCSSVTWRRGPRVCHVRCTTFHFTRFT